VGDVVLVGAGDDDLDRVVLKTLRLVDANRVSDLEGNSGGVGVVVLVVSAG
jgi:hypothetical protein